MNHPDLHHPRRDEDDGFTLIEILVVIIIIGILAAVAIPIFLNQQRTARDSATVADVKNLATNVETALVSNPQADRFYLYSDATGTESPQAEDTEVYVQVEGSDTRIKVSKTEGTELRLNPASKAGMPLANDNTLPTSKQPGSYVIRGWNADGKEYVKDTSARTYYSARGGMDGPAGVYW